MVCIAVNPHMKHSSWDPLSLAHGGKFGKPGLLLAANSSSGWFSLVVYGLLVVWPKGICLIQWLVHFVIKRLKL
jgi:hypothetical protein